MIPSSSHGPPRIPTALVALSIISLGACSDDAISVDSGLRSVPAFVAEWELPVRSIAVDEDGNVNVTSGDDRLIHVYSALGQGLSSWAVILQGDTLTPCEVVFRSGYCIVTTPLEIVVLDRAREVVAHWLHAYDRSGSLGVDTVDMDRMGNVYAIYDGDDLVVKYSPDGSVATKWRLDGQGPITPEFPGIAVDDRGLVYIANRFKDRIDVYSGSGEFVRALGGTGTTGGRLASPYGLDISGGVLYVADLSNYRIQKLTLWGSYLAEFPAAASDGQPGDAPALVSAANDVVCVAFTYAIATYVYE